MVGRLGAGSFGEHDARLFEAQADELSSVIRNHRERDLLEDQLRHSQKMDAVGKLAGGIAHDFNNLLAVILNYARFLADDMDENDPRREDVAEIEKAGGRAAGLVRQLLTFSRGDVASMEILDPGEVVRDLVSLLDRLLGEHIVVVVEADPSAPEVEMDRSRLEQVIVNLAVNARDAMPAGGVISISVRGILVPEGGPPRPGHYAKLTVTDTGMGMSEEVRDRIFEPFFTTKPFGSGTGLGLATTFGIVEGAAGHIAVRSTPGEGASFEVYFPARIASTRLEKNEEGDVAARVGRSVPARPSRP